LTDDKATVISADAGARELLGPEVVGLALAQRAPNSGLAAFALDDTSRGRNAFRFDRAARRGAPARVLEAVVLTLSDDRNSSGKAILITEVARNRMAAELQGPRGARLVEQEYMELLAAARSHCAPAAFLGRSATAQDVRNRLAELASRTSSAFLIGERGSGWGLCARILHYSSSLRGPLLRLRCASLSPGSVERELFGWTHASSAGPGRDELEHDSPGLLQLARGGTLLVEGFESIPHDLQHRVLEAVRSGTTSRVASRRREPCTQRLLAAASASPQEMVANGLHPDAARVLGAETLTLEPLRRRSEDLEDLIPHFLSRFGAARAVASIASGAMAALLRYVWPGNTAELADCLDRACAGARDGRVLIEDLTRPLRLFAEGLSSQILEAGHELDLARLNGRATSGFESSAAGARPERAMRPWEISEDDPISLQFYEKKAILRALDHCRGDRLKAAKLLRVGKSTIYRKVKEYEIR
jgi:two-component system response regulator HydG